MANNLNNKIMKILNRNNWNRTIKTQNWIAANNTTKSVRRVSNISLNAVTAEMKHFYHQ